MSSTVKKGDNFRDQVADLIRVAGFIQVETENRDSFKKTDIRGDWIFEAFEGPVKYRFETKDFDATLPKKECTDFVAEYGTLVQRGEIDKAWLVSRTGFSPDAKRLVNDTHGLTAFTFDEFQRRLLYLDGYLKNIRDDYHDDEIEKFYIHPNTINDEDLESLVLNWIEEENPKPLAIIGGYGQGKSTFARYLAHKLAEACRNDFSKRAPILLPLGRFADEQTVDGLIGKELASRDRVGNYHFSIFQQLNRIGRFVIFLDGFDEMKHGMTPQKFDSAFSEIMKLDVGNARVIVLGRDTAFHDEREFQAIIEGRKVTASGTPYRVQDRRDCLPVYLRGFNLEEARKYVQSYFPIRAERARKNDGRDYAEDWIASRTASLLNGAMDELLERPVHAQMICDIATDPAIDLKNLSKLRLYDLFVQFLIEREVAKRGRSGLLISDVRRKYNAALAWWLWENNKVSTTTLADVPDSLHLSLVPEDSTDFDDIGLKRELIAGCLVEKRDNTIYFGHRSIQEFLVAEYIYKNQLMITDERDSQLLKLAELMNAEIADFLGQFLTHERDPSEIWKLWLDEFDLLLGRSISLSIFEPFVAACRHSIELLPKAEEIIWGPWIAFFVRNGKTELVVNDDKACHELYNSPRKFLSTATDRAYKDCCIAAHVLLCFLIFIRDNRRQINPLPNILANWIDIARLNAIIAEAKRHNQSTTVQPKDNPNLWAFLSASKVSRSSSGNLTIEIDSRKAIKCLHDIARATFATASFPVDDEEGIFSCDVQALYQAFSRAGVEEREIEKVRPYFNDQRLRKKIMPLIVERARRS